MGSSEIVIKGVRISPGGLSPEARTYIDSKFKRILRRQRRARPLLNRLFHALLPAGWSRVEIETLVERRGRVLVVGCAAGIETLALQAANEQVVGFDILLPLVRLAMEMRSNAAPEHRAAHFMAASGGHMPFRSGRFDAVFSDNVVEHLPDGVLRRHLAEASRVLKPGGSYVLTTPNRIFEPVPDTEHVSLHSYAEWEALLRAAGFGRVETPRRRSGPLGSLDWKKRHEGTARTWGAGNRGLKMVVLIATRDS